ncbi:LOW QUALITY PROTEIN: hypothetical protein HID58_067283 [Brassica napus]|uniref:Uncharacterized protein n=1 Tax=Brassica napus TaxID=3708 RepID=A0ABQ7ZI22_BRANA|nr:LOW QUALITY PROTEIN: hypothetical protein HID58_067283 [Brassica napus]
MIPQTDVSGVRHSTFESLRLGRSKHSLWPPPLLRFPELQERRGVYGNHDVVEQIRFFQGSDLTKETTRVVIHLLIDP